jgi:FKBP-type peptidyl-prolyl cis-trans isomerase
MKKTLVLGCLLAALAACETTGVQTDQTPVAATTKAESNLSASERLIEPKATVLDKKNYVNGIKIQWFEKGNGEAVQKGEVYEINFKLKLVNGEVVDGNHLLQRPMIPFLVGNNMQTIGWDLAMQELHVGDFVEIFIPAKLARGEKGIPNVIPPNAANVLLLRVGKKMAPSRAIEGVKVWELESSPESNQPIVSASSQVAIHYFVGTKSNPRYDNSYQRNMPFSFGMKDVSLIPGLRKAMMGAKMYDKLWIIVPAKQAYGSKGYVDLVKPNEDLFYDIFVMDVDGKAPKPEQK